MSFPGVPAHRWEHHEDDDDRAAWLLRLLDASADRLALISVAEPATDAELDALEDDLIRGYDLAKSQRPSLAVQLIPSFAAGDRAVERGLVIVLHEHKWVGGMCVNGCRDEREVVDTDDEAA